MTLVAVLAHELGHVILLRPGLVDREEANMEPLNDLLTVFPGLVFSRRTRHFDSNNIRTADRRVGPRVGSGIFLRNSSAMRWHASPMSAKTQSLNGRRSCLPT